MKTLFLGMMAVFWLIAGQTNYQILAQSTEPKCTAAFLQSLTIRGLHLGMTSGEVLAFFPGVSERQDVQEDLEKANGYPNWGFVSLSFSQRKSDNPLRNEQFNGVYKIHVSFFDGRLVSFTIEYPGYAAGGAAWDSTGQLVSKVAELLRLPPLEHWSGSGSSMRLECGGPMIEVYCSNSGGSTNISISDSSYQPIIRERERARREKRRQEFKP